MEENRIRLDGGFHNDIFHLEEEGRVVRISDKKKTKEMILQEIEWMNFLHEHGVAMSKPEMTIGYEDGRVKTYFEFIKGDEMDVTNELHWNVKTFELWGRVLGRMHELSKQYRVEEISRPVWTVENPDVFDIGGGLLPWVKEEYDRLMQILCTYKITPDTFGLIHNDFHQGNLIISNEGTLNTIDFDECSYNWYAQDIAVSFYHAYWQHHSYNGNTDSFTHIFMNHFFAGYQSENVLHEDMIEQIPIFLKLREIFLYQLFMRKWHMNNLEGWQIYTLKELEEKIKNQIPYAGITDFSIYV
ncbi:phosphotransferase enzyme family protein [Psychrobacillus sp. L4]|uniref:phosphotransferase enzyme family protein n=1 Tax=Psychrobacillus sp. L4 TaxID=3236892 RepID=UPI0036F39A1B